MSEGSEPRDEEILGRLPRTRPGRRSPRRDEAAARRKVAASRAQASAARASAEPDEPEVAPEPASAPGPTDAIAHVAKTGVSVAAGTVGLGLRVAGGTLRALRDTVDRR
jgi:hypothetical protein